MHIVTISASARRFHLPVSVRVSGFFSQPVDGVKVLVSADVWERLVQEVHQVPGAVHLLGGSRTADPCGEPAG